VETNATTSTHAAPSIAIPNRIAIDATVDHSKRNTSTVSSSQPAPVTRNSHHHAPASLRTSASLTIAGRILRHRSHTLGGLTRARKRQLALAAAGIAVVVVVFVYALPKIADYSAVWSTLQELTWEQILLLAAVQTLNIITFAPPFMV